MNRCWEARILAALLALAPALGWAAEAPAAAPSLPPAFEDIDDVPLPDPDLWQRIRKGFGMEALDSPLVAEHEAWYTSRPEYIKRFVDRGSLYLHYIVEQVEKRNMPMEVALLPVIESAFNPKAYSRAKASGIWQFIPSTGKNYGLAQDWWKDNRRDIVAATDAALNYLERLHKMFGDWELALAAYNAGEGTVSRAMAYNQKKGLPTDFLGISPRLKPETRNYVPKLIAVKNIVLSPPAYGIDLESVPNQPYFTAVPAPRKIDVPLAAKLAGMTVEEFVALNPAHNKPVAVASTGTLIVPLDKADKFRENLENYDKPLVSWTTYMAKRGESVEAIARRHGVSPSQLRAVNDAFKLDRKGRLKVAQQVLVPMRGPEAQRVQVAQAQAPASDAQAERAPSRITASVVWYTVRAGDTFYGIARRANMAVEKLLHLNGLSVTNVLRPGLKLRLQ
jgi:membrane-bound lytic murein transglycosylase D